MEPKKNDIVFVVVVTNEKSSQTIDDMIRTHGIEH